MISFVISRDHVGFCLGDDWSMLAQSKVVLCWMTFQDRLAPEVRLVEWFLRRAM
ncbi:MAG: hypothetical protein N3G20_12400 [Verrucomicrobiae bacterium]|nr:hypothetical protein [Verrucomicrobiae bacterium]